jgi:hypothetical protein
VDFITRAPLDTGATVRDTPVWEPSGVSCESCGDPGGGDVGFPRSRSRAALQSRVRLGWAELEGSGRRPMRSFCSTSQGMCGQDSPLWEW